MSTHNLEETNVSGASGRVIGPTTPSNATEADFSAGASDATEASRTSAHVTDTSIPTDMTMVRSTPSGATVNDLSDPHNFGKYELLGEIARGGMGIVYRARQHGLDRLVALKMILGSGVSHESAQRFLQEARAAAALDHPNVVPIYDIGEIGNKPYFTMAFIDGPNLRGFVDSNGLPAIPTVVSLFGQIVAGVSHAHKHGIIHRDLKPANVLMDKDGRPRVTDFGLAKRATTDTQLTATGQVVGTPQYMAPEQARDSKDVGPPADVYSLGAILYFLLAGRAPFQGESFTDLLIKVVHEAPESPRVARPDMPEDLEVLCLRCLAKKPEERFPNADALAAAFSLIAARYPTSSHGSFGLSQSATTPSLSSVPLSSSTASVSTVQDISKLSLSPASPVSTSPPPQSPANRKPVLIGLGLLVAALIAVIAVIATRNKKPNDTVQKEQPQITNPDSNTNTTQTPNPSFARTEDPFAWPAPTNKDFKLNAILDAPGLREKDGVAQLHAGIPIKLRVTAEKDCHVSVWFLEPNGNVHKLFPNDEDTDDHFSAGKERVIENIETTPTEGPGVDRLRVIATTGNQPTFPAGAKNGRFTSYSNDTDRERLASSVRGFVVKKKSDTPAASISEDEIKARVQK